MNYESAEEYNDAMGQQAQAEAEHQYEYYAFLDQLSKTNPDLYACYYIIDMLNCDLHKNAIAVIQKLKSELEKPIIDKPVKQEEPDDLPF